MWSLYAVDTERDVRICKNMTARHAIEMLEIELSVNDWCYIRVVNDEWNINEHIRSGDVEEFINEVEQRTK